MDGYAIMRPGTCRGHTCLDADGIIARAVVARAAGMVVCYGQNHLTLRAMAYGLFCRCILCFGGWDKVLAHRQLCRPAGVGVAGYRRGLSKTKTGGAALATPPAGL